MLAVQDPSLAGHGCTATQDRAEPGPDSGTPKNKRYKKNLIVNCQTNE